jgi:hypothetical protein
VLEGAVVRLDALKHAQDALNHGLRRFDGSVSDARQGEEKGNGIVKRASGDGESPKTPNVSALQTLASIRLPAKIIQNDGLVQKRLIFQMLWLLRLDSNQQPSG